MTTSRQLVATGNGGALANIGENLPMNADRLDLSGSMNFFRRHLPLIGGIAVAVVLAALIYSLLTSKTYLANATVMLTEKTDIANAAAAAPTTEGSTMSGELVVTQVEIITSREMAARVGDALGLSKGLDADGRRVLIDELQDKISAKRTGESFALTIGYKAGDPKTAAQRANEYARQFTQWELQASQQRNSEARVLVESRLVELRDQAQSDTQALQQYRIANNLLSTSGASLTEQEISSYNLEVSKARAESAEDEARLQTALAQLRSGSSGDDVGEALGSAVITSLRSQEALLAGQVANLSARYGAKHPELIRTRSQLDEVRGQIQAEIGRVISNLRAKRAVSADRLGSLQGSLSGARGKLSQNNAAMVGLSELERKAEASQGIYETYLTRYKELLAAEGSEKPNARILTFAEAPAKPLSPNLPLNLVLAVVIGLGLGLVAAYIAEALFHGISTADEVERETGTRYLASIPLLDSVNTSSPHAVNVVQEEPRSVFTESFRALGASINQATNGTAQVIAVTSALPGEGKTVISCCLSHVYAANGLRTMLIDCDLRRQGISRLLDIQGGQKGLIEVLNGSAPLKLDQLAGDHVFCVLPLSPSDDEPEHLLTGQPFMDLLEQLRGSFDRIVLDLPPVLPIAATRILASRADAVVVAAKWRKTTSFALRTALRRLPTDQVNVVGVALSQVDLRRRAYFDSNDPAYYYSQYREYYG